MGALSTLCMTPGCITAASCNNMANGQRNHRHDMTYVWESAREEGLGQLVSINLIVKDDKENNTNQYQYLQITIIVCKKVHRLPERA